jgi:thiamine biosynthesis protein ThiI
VTPLVLVRFAEIFLKRGNRRHFEELLVRNLRAAIGPGGGRLVRGYDRILVQDVTAPEETARRAAGVFGVASVSAGHAVALDVDAIVAAVVEVVARERNGARTFAIRARRANKRFPLDSLGLNRVVGRAVQEASALRVSLDAPDLEVGIEVGHEAAFVFAGTRPGPGGLPVGATGHVALLLSGGIDSPVAGWLAQKRGCRLSAIYFHSFPHVGERTKEKVRELCAVLARQQGNVDLHVVPFAAAQEAVRDGARPPLYLVLYRRLMLRIAERIAESIGAGALCTGESLAQVASQTLKNLDTINRVARLPVLRPLVTNDKNETIVLARRIGTYDLSVQPHDDCCSLFVPPHPELKCTPETAERAERRLDVEALVADAVARTEVLKVAPERRAGDAPT